ncbi:EAL domain-containing protein [Pseudomonas sp. PSE14]|uniref:putative bifunctional diguanylate cyclase/phosphodiesterase n=1 Tax=Pseudomonas sp. PSE14 TaxID=3016341 RepID=UPI0023D8548D|nr:EAL domain-containing protein [Pseudomonas sp. PSE14]WEJ70297.1 EAL domain-containing protein [Pseudomonas sp. PSE14]
MRCPSALPNESERLSALSDYGFDDEALLPSLDPVVQIAVRMFGMPVAAVNMIGSDHVFFAAATGIGEVDMGRDVSFCAHAITQNEVMVVPDARTDERFHDNPLVTQPSGIRFYAGVPLLSVEGHALGALCIIDSQPHEDFSGDDRERLRELARMAADRLELRRIEVMSARTRPLFEEYAGSSPTPVVWFDCWGEIVAWNEAAADLYGYALDEGAGQAFELLLAERGRAAFRSLINRASDATSLDGMDVPAEVTGVRQDGTELALGLTLFCWTEKGKLKFEAVLKDLTALHQEEEALRQLASVDVLTGLANRGRFYRVTEDILVQSRPAAVLMIDLDGFKDVNDSLGHAVGDGILREVAARLERLASVGATVARIGGDEFAILEPNLISPEQAMRLAQAAITRIAEPIVIDAHEVRVAASCGVALAPLHAQEALELVGDADLALFKAKSSGRGHAFVFVPALKMEAAARHLYGMELHRAVANGEFLLYYQPQVSLRDGSLRGAEALIRWQHPQRGLLSPAAFLPSLEGGPLAAIVGAWILDEACARVAYWRRNGMPQIRIGVNLFGAQFRMGNLVSQVLDVLERHGLPADALELEITENIVLNHDDVVLNTLRTLRSHGVGLAFDDFGTGYASLSLLKTYPLSRIKIDRSFVIGMLESQQDLSVIRAILDMARSFDLETIAEGIETSAQRDRLRAEHCAEGQGYLFAKPMPANLFEQVFGIGARQSGSA